MEKEEKLDRILNTREERIEKVKRLYDMSTYLMKYNDNAKLYLRDGWIEAKIKTGVKSAIKTGIYGILLTYIQQDKYTKPGLKITLLNLYSNARDNRDKVLDITFYPQLEKYGLSAWITTYIPGKWEEILKDKYKETLNKHSKSPVSAEYRNEEKGQKGFFLRKSNNSYNVENVDFYRPGNGKEVTIEKLNAVDELIEKERNKAKNYGR